MNVCVLGWYMLSFYFCFGRFCVLFAFWRFVVLVSWGFRVCLGLVVLRLLVGLSLRLRFVFYFLFLFWLLYFNCIFFFVFYSPRHSMKIGICFSQLASLWVPPGMILNARFTCFVSSMCDVEMSASIFVAWRNISSLP